ncbi:thiosulfate dehydrogenase [Pedobacter sp. UYEF25]
MKYVYIICSIVLSSLIISLGCDNVVKKEEKAEDFPIDTRTIPKSKFGDAVRYGRELMVRTAYYIGPNGINGKFAGNKISCSNCHQEAGLKPYSLNLVSAFQNYPQYRAREGKVLSLAERVNNCIMHPLLGIKALPLDGKEMIAFISYLKFINDSSKMSSGNPGLKNLEIQLPNAAARPEAGKLLYAKDCARCHGLNGEGVFTADTSAYIYPPLWGKKSYRAGSSMHRVIKMAQWLLPNMPFDKATHTNPMLTTKEALDLAAFINDDTIHLRPTLTELQYPSLEEKPIDYDKGPFIDSFSEKQHKFGPYKPIIDEYKRKNLKITY